MKFSFFVDYVKEKKEVTHLLQGDKTRREQRTKILTPSGQTAIGTAPIQIGK